MAPQTKGAQLLYETFINPFLSKHAAKFDPVFATTKLVQHLTLIIKACKMSPKALLTTSVVKEDCFLNMAAAQAACSVLIKYMMHFCVFYAC